MNVEPASASLLLAAWLRGEAQPAAAQVPTDAELAATLEQLAAARFTPDGTILLALDRCLQARLLALLTQPATSPVVWTRSLEALIQHHRHLLAIQPERFDRRWAFLLDVLALRSAPQAAQVAAPEPRLLVKGEVRSGVVRTVLDSGAFLDLGGVMGLLHLSDMAWQRLGHPSELLKVGDTLDVRVLAIDHARNRVSLGLKQLGPDPWTAIERRLAPGTRRRGRVIDLDKFGCFVELEPGVDGLVHVSDMDELQRQTLALGAEVDVRVLSIDSEQRRIALSLLTGEQADPWDDFLRLHAIGDTLVGAIVAITEHGLFLRVADGVDGFLHQDDLPVAGSAQAGKDWRQSYHKGMRMPVLVRGIDAVRQRVTLGTVPGPSARVSESP